MLQPFNNAKRCFSGGSLNYETAGLMMVYTTRLSINSILLHYIALYAVTLILVLVLNDSLRTKFKSLSL